ncbi:MAG: MazG family protein [Candidatus Omnitrophica bacterium]|nr:MazG family protein [Candidatus Omnitrophota bacterium]MCF7893788.1 MazG family protein [Candidatus Omnitrophota bacterium]
MKEFDQLVKVIRKLRSPGGCPWDRAQTIETMKKCLLEETYELIDALSDKKYKIAEEELGDVILIVIVIAEMLDEKNKSDLKQSLNRAKNKLIVRHPHVFSKKKLNTKEEVLKVWIKNKAKKKKRSSVKDRLPKTAPALLLAYLFFKECRNLGKKNTGIDSSDVVISMISDEMDKFKKETKKSKKEQIISEILFKAAQLASFSGLDPEELLRQNVFQKAKKVSYGKARKKG